LATGKTKTSVPWAALNGNEETYVDSQYVPEDFSFKEPSKLSKKESYERLKFWFDRQADPNIKTVFQFRRIRGPDGDPIVPPGMSKAAKKKGSKKRAGGKEKDSAPSSDSEDEGSHTSDRSRLSNVRPSRENGTNNAGRDSSSNSDSDSSSSSSSEEEDQHIGKGKKPMPILRKKKIITPLPFGAVPAKQGVPMPKSRPKPKPAYKGPELAKESSSSISATVKKPIRKGRHEPTTGPQFEGPVTRGKKRPHEEAEAEGSTSRKRVKADKPVEKYGPPVGVQKNKGKSVAKGKAKA
jgi:hypothetical protein